MFHDLSAAGSTLNDGKDIGFHAAGNLVYGACVLVANFMLFHHIYCHSLFTTTLLLLMCGSYFGCFYVENLFPFFKQVYRIFDTCFDQKGVWLGFLFVLMCTAAFEMMYNAATQLN